MQKKLSLDLYKDNIKEFNIDSIEYKEENNIISFEYDHITYKITDNKFIRENNEFLFELNITKKECIYTLKETNTTLSIIVLDSSIERTENTITITYKLETEPSINKVEIKFL